jgi:hypothetical protein
LVAALSRAKTFLLVAVLCAVSGQSAVAADLSTSLGAAESDLSAAEAKLSEAKGELPSAKARYRAKAREAKPIDEAARTSRARVVDLRSRSDAGRKAAAGEVRRIEDRRAEEEQERDEEVEGAFGLAVASLAAALLAFFWTRFRDSTPVAALSEVGLGWAIGVCVGGGLALLAVGAGIGGPLGTALAMLAIVLGVAFLLARHSQRVQRRKSDPITGRQSFPPQARQAVGVLMLVLALIGLVGGVAADGPELEPASAELQRRAEGEIEPGLERRLARAEAIDERLQAKATGANAATEAAAGRLEQVRNGVSQAEGSLVSAERRVRRVTAQLVAQTEREEREAEREAEEIEAQEETELVEDEEEAASECDPNYSGCLDPYASDYDCSGGSGDGPLYTGTVEVLGVDHYGLDDDGDGIGCDLG